MTQEIKFRIWDNLKRNYVDASWLRINSGTVSSITDVSGQEFELGDRYVMERYTGMTDRNDIEIYEGDILDASFEGVAKWGNEIKRVWNSYVVDVTFQDAAFWAGIEPLGAFLSKGGKCIGNIHERPLTRN